MNIFHLDENPVIAAQYHCDKHVVKMIVEHVQMMSTNCRYFGIEFEGMTKSTHLNHPSTVWARLSRQNYKHLLKMTIALSEEYTKRYGKVHKYHPLLKLFRQQIHNFPLGENRLTEFVVAAKPEYLAPNLNAVDQYRHIYNTVKRHFVRYKNTQQPYWLKDLEND